MFVPLFLPAYQVWCAHFTARCRKMIFFCILYFFLFLATLADRYKNRSSYRGRLLVVLLAGKGLAARDSVSGKSLFHWHQTDSEIHGTGHKYIIWIFSFKLFAGILKTVREVPYPLTFFCLWPSGLRYLLYTSPFLWFDASCVFLCACCFI